MKYKTKTDKWLSKIEDTMNLGGKSKNTFINYKCHLNKFFEYFEEQDIKKINDHEIADYIVDKYLNENRCPATQNIGVASIRYFYSVCFNRNINKNLLPNRKIGKRMPTYLSKKDFLLIFNGDKNLKHRCWLLLAFCSGLRVHEIPLIKIENIYSNENKLKVLGKGDKERYTLLPDITIKYLRMYYKSLKEKKISGYLFQGYNDESMNSKTIINYFTLQKKKYNLPQNISFHSLRHSFATYFLLNGGNILTLKSMLGHSNISTTSIYIHLTHDFTSLEGVKYV